MSYEFRGRVAEIGDTEQVTDSFRKRLVAVEQLEGTYPQVVPFEFTQDRVDLADRLSVGDDVVIHFDLRGRKWKDRYFSNQNAWKVEVTRRGAAEAAAVAPEPADVEKEKLPF